MAMRVRRQRRRIHIEGWADAPRPFCVTRIADPFGDIDRPPYDAARNLTETGGLPELFAELPNAHRHEIAGNAWTPGRSQPAQPVQALRCDRSHGRGDKHRRRADALTG